MAVYLDNFMKNGPPVRMDGNSATALCGGTDSRLSDARTPLAHTHPASAITSGVRLVAAGVATLTAGTVTVSCLSITANSIVALTPRGVIGGTLGLLRNSSIIAGVSFTVTSLTGALDSTSFGYIVVEPT